MRLITWAVAVVTSVGNNEKRPLRMVSSSHLTQAEINGIEQCSAAFRGSCENAALQILDVVCERTKEFSALVETDEKEFVLGIGGLEKLDRSLFGLSGFVGLLCSD